MDVLKDLSNSHYRDYVAKGSLTPLEHEDSDVRRYAAYALGSIAKQMTRCWMSSKASARITRNMVISCPIQRMRKEYPYTIWLFGCCGGAWAYRSIGQWGYGFIDPLPP